MDETFDSVQLVNWVDRIKNGDDSARDELLRAFNDRLEVLTRRMLRGYPGLRRWEETGDVLIAGQMRLLRSLRDVRPTSVREFLALAAVQIRRELLDLVRHHYGPLGHARHHDSVGGRIDPASAPASHPTENSDLDRWAAFHQGVERLPVDEREIVGLIFYHGWSHADVAALFQISVRTVQRRWDDAMAQLRGKLKEHKTPE